MVKIDQYDDYDEYEYLYDDEPIRKKAHLSKESSNHGKKKRKNFKRGAKQELWDEYVENAESEEDFGKEIMKDIQKETKSKEIKAPSPKKDKPSSARDVKGVQIIYSGVTNILRIESMYNGHKTFGIKFMFKSKDNSAYRIIWFNQNEQERDEVFAKEYRFWNDFRNSKN